MPASLGSSQRWNQGLRTRLSHLPAALSALTKLTLIVRSGSYSERFWFAALSWWTPARTSVFIRSFSPAVLVRQALFIHSNLRPKILSDCDLRRVNFQTCVCHRLQWENPVTDPNFISRTNSTSIIATYLPEGDSRHRCQIEMIALDDYFKPGQRVDLIKMDIQGYELHALRGASRVLADNPGIKLLLEFWPYGLKQAGVRWGRTCPNAPELQYGTVVRKDAWVGSV